MYKNVQVSKFITDTHKNVMLPRRLMDPVCDTPDVSDFVNDNPKNVFYFQIPRHKI